MRPEEAPVWEVFLCTGAAVSATHVGSIRAGTADLALELAHECYGRRGPVWDLWVVPAAAVHHARAHGWKPRREDPAKRYRLPSGYDNAPRWKRFLQQAQTVGDIQAELAPSKQEDES